MLRAPADGCKRDRDHRARSQVCCLTTNWPHPRITLANQGLTCPLPAIPKKVMGVVVRWALVHALAITLSVF